MMVNCIRDDSSCYFSNMQSSNYFYCCAPHPDGWVHDESLVTPLHPPHHVQEGEAAARHGLVPVVTPSRVF